MKMSGVLGLNSRNHLYTSKYNNRKGKGIANSKLETKKVLSKVGVRVPKIYAVIRSQEEYEEFDPMDLPEDFVIKPDNGLGGEGIVVVEKRGKYAGEWVTSQGETKNVEDIKLHIADILAGQYSMDDLPDVAYIEERVKVHPIFRRYSYHGTPDVRVIVFNKVPVMSYVRLPTEESGGRANLFQGAAAVGIDMVTGITTYGVYHAKPTDFFPGSRRKLAGIQIPRWEEILATAIACSEATKLGFMAADIVLQPTYVTPKNGEPGDKKEVVTVPMVLELNAQPGLKIQIANRAGLRDRMERVKGLKIKDGKHGIRVAKALFADPKLLDKGWGRKTVSAVEEVTILGLNGERRKIMAKIDTGADSSSLDRDLARELGLLDMDNHLYVTHFESALGKHNRSVVGIRYLLAKRKIQSRVSIANRSKVKYKMLIGKRDLKDFAVVVE